MSIFFVAGLGPPNLYQGLSRGTDGTLHLTSIWQIPIVLGNVVEILLWVVAVAAVAMVILSGIRFVTSEGDPAKTATAKNALANAVIGVILSASAYLIIAFLAGRL